MSLDLDDETREMLGVGPGCWALMLVDRYVIPQLRRGTTREAITADELVLRATQRNQKRNRRKRKRSPAYMKRKRATDAKRMALKRRQNAPQSPVGPASGKVTTGTMGRPDDDQRRC